MEQTAKKKKSQRRALGVLRTHEKMRTVKCTCSETNDIRRTSRLLSSCELSSFPCKETSLRVANLLSACTLSLLCFHPLGLRLFLGLIPLLLRQVLFQIPVAWHTPLRLRLLRLGLDVRFLRLLWALASAHRRAHHRLRESSQSEAPAIPLLRNALGEVRRVLDVERGLRVLALLQ